MYIIIILSLDQKNGTACCSDTAISFHYISPPMLYVMYYLVYHLRLASNSVSTFSVDDMTFAMRHDFLMEEAYGTFEDFLVRNDFIYEIAHA